jgi:hypothetical protein
MVREDLITSAVRRRRPIPREAILTNRRYLVRRGNHNAHLHPPNIAMQSCKIRPLPARLSRSALPFCSRRTLRKKKSTCRSHEPPRIPASPQLLQRKRPHLPTMHTTDPHQRRLRTDTRLKDIGNNHRRQSEQWSSNVTHEHQLTNRIGLPSATGETTSSWRQ